MNVAASGGGGQRVVKEGWLQKRGTTEQSHNIYVRLARLLRSWLRTRARATEFSHLLAMISAYFVAVLFFLMTKRQDETVTLFHGDLGEKDEQNGAPLDTVSVCTLITRL